jgi:hypothetical protein
MLDAVTRSQVLGFRVRAQQLDRESGSIAETAVLDIGVQDTGPDGAMWALANRGVDVTTLSADDLVKAWTIRGAPHVYRRADLPSVAAAVEPFSDADAGKRIYNASKPLQAAGISNLAALDSVAAAMRSIVTVPMAKGEVSTRMTAVMDKPYLRYCRACKATHLHEMPFRLAALRAGLELQADTSPPVLRRVAGLEPAAEPLARHDVVRAYLRLLGPATPKQVADYLDAPVRDVKARWPSDTVQVSVASEQRWLLADDSARLTADPVSLTRLLGPFDLFLQAKDRALLVDDPGRAKALWPVLGRPGAVLLNGEIVGWWRPRQTGRNFAVRVELWAPAGARVRKSVQAEAERLASYRRTELSGVDFVG